MHYWINVKSRYCAETKRLLRAINGLRTQDALGRGKAYEVYMLNARNSAAKIIAAGF